MGFFIFPCIFAPDTATKHFNLDFAAQSMQNRAVFENVTQAVKIDGQNRQI